MIVNGIHPLVSCYIANWEITVEVVDFPIKHCDFP